VLAHWRRHTHHPRLLDAYTALLERVGPRVEHLVRHAQQAGIDRTALTDAALTEIDAAKRIDPELARLKWLVAGRSGRLAREGIPGYRDVEPDEADERDHLEHLLGALGRGLC